MSATEQRRVPGAGKALWVPNFSIPLPASIESEAAAVSCVLQWPREMQAMMASRGMTIEFFTVPSHRVVVKAVFELMNRGSVVDFTTVAQLLMDWNELERIGGVSFLSPMFSAIPSGIGAGSYLDIIASKFALRTVILDLMPEIKRAYEDQDALRDIISNVTKAATKLAHIGHKAHKPTIAETVMHVTNERQRRLDTKKEIVGMTTFLPQLNTATGGLRRNNLRIIAAPENTGKTIACLNDIERVVIDYNKPALIFSMEMTRAQLVERLIASMAWVTMDAIDNPANASEPEETRIAEASMKLAVAPLTIEEGDFNRDEIVAMARAWKANNPEGALIVIENLQLLRHRIRDNRSTSDEISEDARVFKLIAKELDLTVDVASQMTGESTKGSKGPQEHADMVLVLDEEYITVKKSRSGGKGLRIPITIDGDHQRIIPREEEEEKPRKRGKKNVDI